MIPSPSALLDSLSLRPQGATVDELHGFLLRAGIAVEKLDLVRSLGSLHRDGRVSLGLDRRGRGARKWHDGTRVGRVRTAERDTSGSILVLWDGGEVEDSALFVQPPSVRRSRQALLSRTRRYSTRNWSRSRLKLERM